MKIVIDACVILAILMQETNCREAIEKTRGCTLISPECLLFEMANGLTAMVKRHRINARQAIEIYRMYKTIPVKLCALNSDSLESSLRIACEENHYVYDAFYLDCALKNSSPVLTFDARFKEFAEKRGVKCL